MSKLGTAICRLLLAASLACGSVSAEPIFTVVDYPGATDTALWDVNNSGTAVGWAVSAGRAFGITYTGGIFSVVAAPDAAAVSWGALGISDSGIVVGSWNRGERDSSGRPIGEIGYILEGGVYTPFAIAGAVNTFLRAISPDGRYISGNFETAGAGSQGFVYDRLLGTLTLIGDPFNFTIAQGITNGGVVVGSEFPIGGFIVEVTTGTRTNLDAGGPGVTRPRAIDSSGELAGWITGPGGVQGFFGTLGDFTLFSVPGADSTFAEGNNDLGWIVGEFIDTEGRVHGFVMMRVPEPGVLSLVCIGGLLLFAVRRLSLRAPASSVR
ncbi:MAG TPA: hypothetical protein VNK91_11765 [Burkholderiaceae bacterium]|jgi:hypothetical protein|nr:hypothetical protein [Burkholderiaceae bacterium]